MQTFLIGRGPDFTSPTASTPSDETHKKEHATVRFEFINLFKLFRKERLAKCKGKGILCKN
jgi:hypothetical protein